jgi:deoxycytidine triphosphate deaminase
MILTSDQIEEFGIVSTPVDNGKRATTYDATVGEIILRGNPVKGNEYKIPNRGMIWVISNETFKLPNNVTGLATLRTTWTHKGILALNVGIIDPGYNGPLATALVNFGEKTFSVKKGDPFFRILFHFHNAVTVNPHMNLPEKYSRDISDRSHNFSNSFLNISSLAKEVAEQITSTPRWAGILVALGMIIAIFSVVVAIYATCVPFIYTVHSDYVLRGLEIHQLEKDVESLRKRQQLYDETMPQHLKNHDKQSAPNQIYSHAPPNS